MRKAVWQGLMMAVVLCPTVALAAGQTGQEKAAPKDHHASATGGSADKAFILEAASGGMMEVELGKMAANQASSDDVKKFGQRMVDDHSKANNELSALAQKKNITLPSSMNKSHQATHDHLAKLNGADFDKAYIQHMVADHTKDVREFQREAKSGTDPEVKAWAGQTVTTLQSHLTQAKQVAAAVGASSTHATGKAKK